MRRAGPLLVVGAAVLWGTTGTAQALGPTADPFSVGAVRLAVGGTGLLAAGALTGGLARMRRLPPGPLALAALGVAAYQPLFFAGVGRSGVAIGTVVAIGTGPIVAGLLAFLVEGWRPTLRWTAATLVAVAGVGLIGSPGGEADLWGVLLAAGAGTSYAVYAVVAKRMLDRASPVTVMAGVFGLGAALSLPGLLMVDLSWLGRPDGMLMAAWLGLGATTASYLLFGLGLRLTPVANAVTLSLAEPLTAVALGVMVLSERPPATAWVGAFLLLAGLAVAGTEVEE
ncbi:MAG: transporter [Acidimicrobiia bacterium]|nr:MAG: transporter [Acidimicrobiia bacterium]